MTLVLLTSLISSMEYKLGYIGQRLMFSFLDICIVGCLLSFTLSASKILEKTLLSYWDPNKTNNGLPVLGPWQLIQYLTAQLIKFSTGCHLQKKSDRNEKWKSTKTLISRSLLCWVVQCNLGSNLRRYFGTISNLHYSHSNYLEYSKYDI